VKNGLIHAVKIAVRHKAGSISYETCCDAIVFEKHHNRTTDAAVTCLECIAPRPEEEVF
jgi:hypothetical protein